VSSACPGAAPYTRGVDAGSGLARLRRAFEAEWRSEGKELAHGFEHLVRRCEELLRDEDLRGQSVLEVGAGRGFLSIYALVCRGAAHVTALDEYEGHGSSLGSHDGLVRLRAHLSQEPRLEIARSDFLEWTPSRRFDCILLVNALHHIVETPRPLSRDAEPWQRALRTFERVRRALAPGGRLIVQELSCRNYCPIPHYRRRMSGVRWRTKQAPREWCKALRASGFTETRVRYRYPLNLPERAALRPLLANRLVSLATDSSYVIRASAS